MKKKTRIAFLATGYRTMVYRSSCSSLQSLSSYYLPSETSRPNSMALQREIVWNVWFVMNLWIHRIFHLCFLIFSIRLIFSVVLTFYQKLLHHRVPCGVVFQIKFIILNFVLIKNLSNPLYKRSYCQYYSLSIDNG